MQVPKIITLSSLSAATLSCEQWLRAVSYLIGFKRCLRQNPARHLFNGRITRIDARFKFHHKLCVLTKIMKLVTLFSKISFWSRMEDLDLVSDSF